MLGGMKLPLGQPAPDFRAVSDDGRTIRLQDLRGQWVVLYFYPKASSYGCSVEAQKFETFLPEFEALGAQVIGISTDTEEDQAAFREKCHLSYPLLPDPDKTICREYGVLGGLTGLMGVAGRASFVIDPAGILVHQKHDMNHTVHVGVALAAIQARQA